MNKETLEVFKTRRSVRKFKDEPVYGVASIALGYRDCEIPPAKERRADYVVKI